VKRLQDQLTEAKAAAEEAAIALQVDKCMQMISVFLFSI
jgi:hypothetical protein